MPVFSKLRYWLQIGWSSKCNLCSSKRIKQRQSLLYSQKLTLQLISLSWLLSLIHDFSFYLYLNWNYGFQLKFFAIHLHGLHSKQMGFCLPFIISLVGNMLVQYYAMYVMPIKNSRGAFFIHIRLFHLRIVGMLYCAAFWQLPELYVDLLHCLSLSLMIINQLRACENKVKIF